MNRPETLFKVFFSKFPRAAAVYGRASFKIPDVIGIIITVIASCESKCPVVQLSNHTMLDKKKLFA